MESPTTPTYAQRVSPHKHAHVKVSERGLDLVVVVFAQDLEATSAPSPDSISMLAPSAHAPPRRAVEGEVVEPHHRVDENELLPGQQPAHSTTAHCQPTCMRHTEGKRAARL